jgi:hypothetical protein
MAARTRRSGVKASEFELPDSIFGRFVFALVCLFLLPVSSIFCWVLISSSDVFDLPAAAVKAVSLWLIEVAYLLVFESMLVGVIVFSAAGLVWSIARPGWAAAVLQVGFSKIYRAIWILTLTAAAILGLIIVLTIIHLF